MSTTSALFVLVVSSLITYTCRSSMILTLADRTLPQPVERALANVGPAVLAALTVNLAVGPGGVGSVEFAEVAAIVVASAVALWRGNLVWTFAAGMLTLWLLAAVT